MCRERFLRPETKLIWKGTASRCWKRTREKCCASGFESAWRQRLPKHLRKSRAYFSEKRLFRLVGIPPLTRYHACACRPRLGRNGRCSGGGGWMSGKEIARRMIFFLALSTSIPAAGAWAQETGAAAPQTPDLRWAVKIPMRDGVTLNATVVQPHGQKDPLPVIFTFTPYIGDSYLARAMYFAQHGYVYALVDVRGRGNSGGAFEPFVNEAKDGYDVVEWLAKQSYSNGKVTMWGGSYAGFDQWTTLKEFPPHLTTIVPAAAAHPGVDFPFQYNIFGPYVEQWLTFTSGVTSN